MTTTAAHRGPALSPHSLDRIDFDALAAGKGDGDTVAELLDVERSWRMVMLLAVLDAAGSHPDPAGPLPPVTDAWSLFVRAEQAAPEVVASILLHPHTGTWAGYALRRLRGSLVVDTPLWIDVGYLHALAAAAATRAGIDFQVKVPVRDGVAFLPTLGAAAMPGPFDLAEVRGKAGEVHVTAGATSVRVPATGTGSHDQVNGWMSLRHVSAEASGVRMRVNLDDLDPYRDLRTPAPPRRLSDTEAEQWSSLLQQAWQLLVQICPDRAAAMARGLFSVVPLPAAERFRTMSASAGDAFGCTTVSEPEGAIEMAVTLVHEFQHIKLGGVLHMTPLHSGEPSQRLYAPWRDDPRPLGGVLQGAYAFVGITDFWRALRHASTGGDSRLAQFEFARWRQQVWATLQLVWSLPELTEVGRRLVAGLIDSVRPWQDEDVPAELLAMATAAAADHRARWRAHHLRPEPRVIAELARAYEAGEATPAVDYPEPVVGLDMSGHHLDSRATLMLWRLTDETGFADLLRSPTTVGSKITGATAADLAYVAGEIDRAQDLYLADLAVDPEDVRAWTGLGLTRPIAEAGSANVLLEQPEMVRAVHRAVRESTGTPVGPLELTAWLEVSSPALAR